MWKGGIRRYQYSWLKSDGDGKVRERKGLVVEQ
jgi:hypothetical protein